MPARNRSRPASKSATTKKRSTSRNETPKRSRQSSQRKTSPAKRRASPEHPYAHSCVPRDHHYHPMTTVRSLDTTLAGKAAPRLPLYKREEAEEWMQGNPYIHHGYRVKYTVMMCLKSLFRWHNETGNVWTHVIGFIIFLILSHHVFTDLLKPVLSHTMMFAFFSFGNLACMLLSASYHLFSAHSSKRVYEWMMMLDYMGITCLTVFSFFPPVYLIFTCQPEMRYIYLGSISTLGVLGIAGPMFEQFNAPEYTWLRLSIFLLLGGSGIVPIIHFLFAIPFNSTTGPLVGGVALMLLFYGLGLLFYIFKIPERWFPGRFDYWLHSHQLWHTFVLAAALVHFVACMGMYKRWDSFHDIHC